ncbi:Synaptic vesicle protein [Operophtera brumata]|uniref:Synaptic vesicle protein n=1 Tax=Operophtera brumata TaxID=104452 RepID=A0A0L7LCJ5_OPEBR|nr:Synaptic vesicle protein [Operophtera brumata]
MYDIGLCEDKSDEEDDCESFFISMLYSVSGVNTLSEDWFQVLSGERGPEKFKLDTGADINVLSIPCALSCIGAVYSCESPKYLLTAGEDEKALEVLKYMFEMNSGQSSDLYQVESTILDEENVISVGKGFWTSIVAQTVPIVNPFIVWIPVIADAFMSSVESGATGLTICEMIRLSRNVTDGDVDKPKDCSMNDTAMTMVFCISLILAALNIVAGFVLNCVGKRRLYIGIQMLSGIAALSISASSMWILSAILLLTLMTDVLNFGFLSSFAVDLFPTCVKAKAVCLMLMLGRGSTILGINVLKQLIEKNCEAAFYTFGVITIYRSTYTHLVCST